MKIISNTYPKKKCVDEKDLSMHFLTHSVFLCGFMGAGKTCIGKLLGRELRVPFLDTDTYISDTRKMSISDIFSISGEKGFREYEYEALKQISDFPPHIVATGGGLPLFERNLRLLKKFPIICLMPDFDTIYPRIRNDKNRPLILDKSYEHIKALYESRKKKYLQSADFVVKNSSTPKNCVKEIICYLERNALFV